MGGSDDFLGYGYYGYYSGQTDERKETNWEESRGTYNPDAFLTQFQACPWSSA